MHYRILFLVATAVFFSSYVQAQDLTVAGGNTFGVATKHDYASVEINVPWKEQIWASDHWSLDLNYAFSLSRFHDINNVYLASWAPNIILCRKNRTEFYPYLQFGFGVALLSDDYFESEDNDPRHTGTTDMGSHGQFESSITVGMAYGRLGLRARAYHYSNANLSSTNDGIDVAELGFSYRF
jgi:hypothetical protein